MGWRQFWFLPTRDDVNTAWRFQRAAGFCFARFAMVFLLFLLFFTLKKVLFYFLSLWGERFREGIYMVRFFMFYRILLAKDRMKDNVHLFSLLCFVRTCLDRRGLEENEVD